MTVRFADSWLYIALLDKRDQHHHQVRQFLEEHDDMFMTTRWVLAETANALSESWLRPAAVELLKDLERDPSTIIVRDSDALYTRGFTLYSERPDKAWSLTDCISFAVMHEHDIHEALTGDHHFEQAGFRPLFAA